jgi:hypothetical protein
MSVVYLVKLDGVIEAAFQSRGRAMDFVSIRQDEWVLRGLAGDWTVDEIPLADPGAVMEHWT